MKSSSLAATTTTTALLSFSFTLLALTTIPVIVNSQPAPTENNAISDCKAYIPEKGSSEKPVTDIYGQKVRTDMEYYVIQANARDDVGKGSESRGISLITNRRGNGLMDVILHPNFSNNGTKIRFSQAFYSSDTTVMQLSDLNFILSELPGEPSWSVDITDGGVKGNPGGYTFLNWFKFHSDGGKNTYRIIHCPSVCLTCCTLCNHIGLSQDAGCFQRLAVLPKNPKPLALSVQIVPAVMCEEPCVFPTA